MKAFKETVDFIRKVFENPEGFIPLHEPKFVGKEKEYVLDAIDSTFVSSVGKYVDRFEEDIKKYTGAKYAIACVNGTAALHLALQLAGVKRGDLVITQSLTFIATSNAISYIGAEPLYLDIDNNTLGLSDEKMADFLNENTHEKEGVCYHNKTGKRISACVPMHTFGHPVSIAGLSKICNQYHINLVEDSAESLGSLYQNKHTGTFGLLGVYSFNGNKTITCGGGGVIVTNNEELAKLGKHLSTQAKVPHKWEFNHDFIGYNYRLPNLNAAFACAQLEMLDKFVQNKRDLSSLYQDFFSNSPFKFIQEPINCKSNYWLNAILLANNQEREEFLNYTNNNGVMTRPSWVLNHKLPMFDRCLKGNLENSIGIEERLVNIPSSVRINTL